MKRICIPDYEYQERIKKAAALVRAKGLDVMLVSSTESDLESSTSLAPCCFSFFKKSFTFATDIPDATRPVKVTMVSLSTGSISSTALEKNAKRSPSS